MKATVFFKLFSLQKFQSAHNQNSWICFMNIIREYLIHIWKKFSIYLIFYMGKLRDFTDFYAQNQTDKLESAVYNINIKYMSGKAFL